MNNTKKESVFMSNNSAHKAFTLAEVLITLGVIGVVAAMTIPILMKNYEKKEYVTALKKAYSEMNQVLQQMAVDGETIGNIGQYFGSTTSAGAKIASYYKVIKNCGTTTGEECFAKFDNNYDGSANSTTIWANNVNDRYKFVSADGMSFAILSWNSSCTSNYSFVPNGPTAKTCGYVYIDVNGSKKPNCWGRDVFTFLITSNATPMLYPHGGFYLSFGNVGTTTDGGDYYWNYQGTRNRCSPTSREGTYCPARIMEKGWVMDY